LHFTPPPRRSKVSKGIFPLNGLYPDIYKKKEVLMVLIAGIVVMIKTDFKGSLNRRG
jgi:hypothetical protein